MIKQLFHALGESTPSWLLRMPLIERSFESFFFHDQSRPMQFPAALTNSVIVDRESIPVPCRGRL
jgi:hypothetical protein